MDTSVARSNRTFGMEKFCELEMGEFKARKEVEKKEETRGLWASFWREITTGGEWIDC